MILLQLTLPLISCLFASVSHGFLLYSPPTLLHDDFEAVYDST